MSQLGPLGRRLLRTLLLSLTLVLAVGLGASAAHAKYSEEILDPNPNRIYWDPIASVTTTMGSQDAGTYTVSITNHCANSCLGPYTYVQNVDFAFDPANGRTVTVPFESAVTAPGQYTIRIIKGGYFELARSAFTIYKPEIPNVSVYYATPSTFFPHVRDGYLDKTLLEWSSFNGGPEPAKLEILNSSGRAVVTRSVSPTGSWSWRGERDSGGIAPAGTYTARVTVANAVGQIGFAETPIRVAHRRVWSPVQVARKGDQTSRRREGRGCQTAGGAGVLHMDCVGGTSAEAFYTFTIPRKSRGIDLTSFGNEDRGTRGVVDLTYTRPTPRRVVARIRITGSRAYIVRRVTLQYRARVLR